MKLTYLCLQPRSGSGASTTHVDGLVGALRDEGVEVDLVQLPTASPSLVVRLLTGLWLQARHVRPLRRSDAVYVRMHPTAALLPWLLGATRLLVEVNGVPEDYVVVHPRLRWTTPIIGAGIRWLLRRAQHVVVVTDGLAQHVGRWVPEAEVTVVPNAADPDRFRADLPRPGDVPSAPYAVFFGALAPWQGLELVLAAAEHPNWPSDLRLVVVGDGPARPEVDAAAARKPEHVVVLGPRAADELPPYVAHAELSFVVKTYHDPVAGQSPLKLYESLAAGTPVVATPSHGCTDVAPLQGAVFVASPTAEGLVEAVRDCLAASRRGDPRLHEALTNARRNETWAARSRQIMGLLAATVAPHGSERGTQRPTDPS